MGDSKSTSEVGVIKIVWRARGEWQWKVEGGAKDEACKGCLLLACFGLLKQKHLIWNASANRGNGARQPSG